MPTYNIIAFSGSLRKDSYNTHLLNAFKAQSSEGVTIELVDYRDVPLYDQDMDAAFPAQVTALKEKIQAADGIIISTPEYNRGIPGVLKNMIDFTSRPWGQSAWVGKPVLVVGATIAPTGTALAQYALKQVLLYLNAQVLGQPEFYLSTAQSKFAEDGTLTDEDTKKYVDGALAALVARIGLNR